MIELHRIGMQRPVTPGAARPIGQGLLCAVLALLLAACVAPPTEFGRGKAPTGSSSEFACGGALEDATWALWEERGLPFLREQMIATRLEGQGNTYALYDIQTYFHNLVALMQRCHRPERMREMADALMPVFGKLEPLPGNPGQRAWVCRGGPVCNTRNRLIDTEVILVSVQGLGLMSNLAEMMAASDDPATRHHPFVAATAQASAEHLLRWGDAQRRARWVRLAEVHASDVKDARSALFFTDQPLWMITVYANLAGLYAQQPALADALTPAQHDALRGAVRDALVFFRSRIIFIPQPRLGGAPGADIDRGFWRLYADGRYAGYEGAAPPATCVTQPDGSRKAQLQVEAPTVPLFSSLGWDFSHTRRLVHALDALERNRRALQSVFGLQIQELPAPSLGSAFARQLVGSIWNGDTRYPLFSNYWNGTNGWYRVAYDNGTGYCSSGYPPFGMSDSFTTGGYATWARHEPVLGDLGRTLYRLSKSSSEADQAFVRKHYGGLLVQSVNNRMVTQLMFWPTLIQ